MRVCDVAAAAPPVHLAFGPCSCAYTAAETCGSRQGGPSVPNSVTHTPHSHELSVQSSPVEHALAILAHTLPQTGRERFVLAEHLRYAVQHAIRVIAFKQSELLQPRENTAQSERIANTLHSVVT